MAIVRPIKRGDVRSFDESYQKGFKSVQASEVDADLDTLYDAWNLGTINIASGSVGSDAIVDGSVSTSELADNSVTDAKIVSVDWTKVTGRSIVDADVSATAAIQYTKITGAPTSLPPSGTASGALTGTYPAPTLNPITRFPLSLGIGTINSSGAIVPGQSGGYITVNATTGPVNVALPTGEAVGYSFWIVKVDSSANAVNLQSSVGGENIGVAGGTPGGGATVSWTKQYAGYFVTRTQGTGRTAWTALPFGAAALP